MTILVSQIGYDVGRHKHALIMGDASMSECPDGASFELISTISKAVCYTGSVRAWGEKWNHQWHIADFSPFDLPGDYVFRLVCGSREPVEAETRVHIGRALLWHETWFPVSIGQLDVRAAYSYKPEGGWKDCGSDLQELSSHVIMLMALCDLLETKCLPSSEKEAVYGHLITGAEYLAACQAEEGSFVHEIRRNPSVSTGNCANASMALARIARLIAAYSPEHAREYREHAETGYRWIRAHGPLLTPFCDINFSITHGAPPDMQTPPREYMTRDLLALLSAALELYRDGRTEYESDLIRYARQICARQIPEEKAEYGFFGHFYTYDSCDFSEKADLHCGAWDLPYKNYNQGAHFPHRILPLLQLMALMPEHEDHDLWYYTVKNFAYGYFLPACESSPFGILPAGIYRGEGLCCFSGWYHGHAKIYGYAAELAEAFCALFGDERFRAIADGNLQWIAGLNPAGTSLIVGIGDRHAVDWNALKGTIINGFDASPQFSIAPVSHDTDLPAFLDDEGGIHHCAGYLTGLCAVYGHDPVGIRI